MATFIRCSHKDTGNMSLINIIVCSACKCESEFVTVVATVVTTTPSGWLSWTFCTHFVSVCWRPKMGYLDVCVCAGTLVASVGNPTYELAENRYPKSKANHNRPSLASAVFCSAI